MLSSKVYLIRNTNLEIPHYALLSSFLLLSSNFLQNIIPSTILSKTSSAYVRIWTWQTEFNASTVSYYDLFLNVSTVFFVWWPCWWHIFSDSCIQQVRSAFMSREINLESFSNDFRPLLQQNQFYPSIRPHKLITTWFRVFNFNHWFPWTFVMASVTDTPQCLWNSMCLWPEQIVLSLILRQFSKT
jgi:hypothetical protein